jgi:hypothetical protein
MNFQEAITLIKQTKKSDNSFIGIFFRPEDKYFGYYTIHAPELDDSEYISISCEGGNLFSDYGEEDFYSLDDVPEEALNLHYKSAEALPNISGDCSEYALFKLFPDLPNPDDIFTNQEKSDFIKLVKERVGEWGTTN